VSSPSPGADDSQRSQSAGAATHSGVDRMPDSQSPQDNEGEVEHIASLVFARIENKLEHHLHTQMEMPSADQAADLRERAPEVYQAWVDIARQKADTENYIQRAQYDAPERVARTGRPWAVGSLVLVLGFCAYVASLGQSGIYVAGIIAAIDLVAMLGLFFGIRPSWNRETRNTRKEVANEPSNTRELNSETVGGIAH
jgi:hypothetical protein